MFTKIINAFSKFWKQHICGDFPSHYDPLCFECKEGPSVCPGCEHRTWNL